MQQHTPVLGGGHRRSRTGRRLLARLFLALTAFYASGCVQAPPDLPRLEASPATPGADRDAYRLGPGDKMRLTVFGADDLASELTVGDTGAVRVPLVGAVAADGLTQEGLATAIEERLREGYMRNPKVTLQVVGYRPVYVLGEVTRPGGYPFAPAMTLQNAVALGGGYSYRAIQDYAIVTRQGKKYRADPDAKLQPDDVVSVPERLF